MATTNAKKTSLNTWLYIGVGLLVFLLVFLRLADTEKLVRYASKPEQPLQPDATVTSEQPAVTMKDKTKDATAKTVPGKPRTPAYSMPQIRNLIDNNALDLGQKAVLQFGKDTISISYESRSPAGERRYRMEITGAEHNQHQVFASYDSLLAFHAADLNANARAEIYLVWISDGSGSYGMIEGHEIHPGRLITMRFPDQNQLPGYRGYDSFRIYPDYIEHSYPIYSHNDPNSNNTGGTAYHRYSFAPNTHEAQVKTTK